MNKKELGQRLRGLRTYCGWRVKEVEAFLPELTGRLSAYESGKREIPDGELNRLAMLYDFDVDKLLDAGVPIPQAERAKRYQGLLTNLRQMLERTEATGRYNFLFYSLCTRIRICHNPVVPDEIVIVVRNYDEETRSRIPLERFRKWDAERIEEEISYLCFRPWGDTLIHIPANPSGRDSLKTRTRMVLIRPLPKGCGEYEAFWRTIPELDIAACDSPKEGIRLIRELQPDCVVYRPSNGKGALDFLKAVREALGVCVRCMPHIFLLCRGGDDFAISNHGGHLLAAASLPSAAWFAKYALLDLHIQDGFFSFTRPPTLAEIQESFYSRMEEKGLRTENEKLAEVAVVYALTFFQDKDCARDAFAAAVQELGLGNVPFWRQHSHGERKYLSAGDAATILLYDAWKKPYRVLGPSAAPCSPIAKELVSAEWHKHLRVASPVQSGGGYCDDDE